MTGAARLPFHYPELVGLWGIARQAGSGGGKKGEIIESVLAIVRSHLVAGGSSIIPVTDFKAMLRQAGIKNGQVEPWLDGYSDKATSFHTGFEADDIHKPKFICLGRKGHIASSSGYRLSNADF